MLHFNDSYMHENVFHDFSSMTEFHDEAPK